MIYEYIIRQSYGCARYGTSGADASIFRKLERFAHDKESYDYSCAICAVRSYLNDAVRNLQDKHYPDQEQKAALEDCLIRLRSFDYSEICKAMDDVSNIMKGMKSIRR